jgi:hypothetical protein
MTAPSSRPTQCPHCGYDNHVETFESINSHDRQVRDRLLSGALWTWQCAQCTKKTFSLYPVLYHDMRAWCMIYYLDQQMTDDPRVIEQMVPTAEQLTALRRFNHSYRFRLCRSLEDFIEKIRIIDAGLDDRAMEYLRSHDRSSPFRFSGLVGGEGTNLEFRVMRLPSSKLYGHFRPIELPYSVYTDALAKIKERMSREPDVASGFIVVDRAYIEERFPELRPKPEPSEPMVPTSNPQPSGDMGSVVFGKTRRAGDERKPWWRFW